MYIYEHEHVHISRLKKEPSDQNEKCSKYSNETNVLRKCVESFRCNHE